MGARSLSCLASEETTVGSNMHCPPYLPNILADCRNHISETSLSAVMTNPFSPVMCALVHTNFLDCLCLSASLRLCLFCKAFSFPVMLFIDARLAHVIQSNTEHHAMTTAIGGTIKHESTCCHWIPGQSGRH